MGSIDYSKYVFYILYSLPKTISLLQFIKNKSGKINSNINESRLISFDISLHKSFIKYTSFLPNDITLARRLYHLENNLNHIPKCSCGNELRFITYTTGYKQFCSNKCSANDKDLIARTLATKTSNNPNWKEDWANKKATTYKNKTGLDHNTQDLNNNVKRINTLIKNHGEDYIKVIHTKSQKTYEEKTGYKTPWSNPIVVKTVQAIRKSNSVEIEEKRIATWKERYNLSNPIKKHITNLQDIEDKAFLIDNFLFEDNSVDMVKMKDHFNCHANWCFQILKRNNIQYTSSKSRMEQTVFSWLTNMDIQFVHNDRTTIKPLELDFIIGNTAIELDGLLYHSSGLGVGANNYANNKEDSLYHLNKTKLCEKKGIQLFHIFENEFIEKNAIVKSMVYNLLNKNTKIFARKCTIKDVNNKDRDQFLEENHMQGKCNSSVSIGLYYSGDLVSLMTFGKPRFNKNYDYELIRFCSKLNTTVVGGASKLLKHFRNKHTGSIISYANRRWSRGNIYEKLGFIKINETKPNYFYFKLPDLTLRSRIQFQKHKLKEFKSYSEEKTESTIMYEEGYRKIYDCGNLVYVIN